MATTEEAVLAMRMRLTVTGQVTWANPDIGKKCAACRHYVMPASPTKRQKGKGQCALVRALTRADGVFFDGVRATACSKFEAGAAA